ncbi:MAG: AraC family transcriptional regulator [Eubacteriales bacterium]|nr:AraC family transcriptional regulator [Eubacteriales bacterium]
MDKTQGNVTRKFRLLEELLTCGANVYLWSYDASGEFLETNCPDLVLDTIFTSVKCKEYMLTYAGKSEAPLVLGTLLGLMWCAAFEKHEGNLVRIWVIGPVFNTELSLAAIERAARQFDVPMRWRDTFRRLLQELPVIPSTMFFQYGLMLHYCATGEKLSRSDIQFQQTEDSLLPRSDSGEDKDRHQTYLAEQALLRNIREGDLNYQSDLERAGQLSRGVQIASDTPLMQAVITEAVFISLCVRAAIEGGLSPEQAYSIGDRYIQSATESRSITALRNIGHAMYEDLILRVHRARTDPALSAQIQSCRDYIALHLEEDLSLALLARRVGYTPYYLSRKFKQEMNCTVSRYIRLARVERAKALLRYSGDSIQNIAGRLRFCSTSHFAEVFREVTGSLPHEYRRAQEREQESRP